MRVNREGFMVSNVERECTRCGIIFPTTSKTVTCCPKCNSERVKSSSPEYKMYQRAKMRAKRDSLEFSIEVSDIIIPEVCPVFGMRLECKSGRSGGERSSPSIDKINPSKGYIKGNIRVISHLANIMKSNATKEQLIVFANWILSELSAKSNELSLI